MRKLTPKQKEVLAEWIRKAERKQEAFRAQAILLLHNEMDTEVIRSFTGYSRAQSFRLKKNFLRKGRESLIDKRKGKPKELLTKLQRDELLETIKTKTPKDFGYTNEHWTTGFLGKWIEEKYEVKYKSKTSLYLVFKQAKFTYHKPGRVYDKHDEIEVSQWKAENEPKIYPPQNKIGDLVYWIHARKNKN
ncbi:MAG: winged helix-turn-helix domain-containing protein [Candidatus Moraniibacteriota bacterium]|nr:MAG: winged helix-turn-helix domain-containing protein [Candidatus Moranbacteria bacterium]